MMKTTQRPIGEARPPYSEGACKLYPGKKTTFAERVAFACSEKEKKDLGDGAGQPKGGLIGIWQFRRAKGGGGEDSIRKNNGQGIENWGNPI